MECLKMANATQTTDTAAPAEAVRYGKVIRTPSLKRNTTVAQKLWLEWKRAGKSGGMTAKFAVTKVKFLGASYNGEGFWLKDGELPRLKASEGLAYYFEVADGQVVKAEVKDRCLFLGDKRVTFSELLVTQEAAPTGTLLAVESNDGTVTPSNELTMAEVMDIVHHTDILPVEGGEVLLLTHEPALPMQGAVKIDAMPEAQAPVKRVKKAKVTA